jgi:hypothetical protein
MVAEIGDSRRIAAVSDLSDRLGYLSHLPAKKLT